MTSSIQTLEQKLRELGDGEHIAVLRRPGTHKGQPVVVINRGKAAPRVVFTSRDKDLNCRVRIARIVRGDDFKKISKALLTTETRTTTCTAYVGIHDRRIEAALAQDPASVTIIDTLHDVA